MERVQLILTADEKQLLRGDENLTSTIRDLTKQGKFTYLAANGDKVKVGSSLAPFRRGGAFGEVIYVFHGDFLEKWVHKTIPHVPAPGGIPAHYCGSTEWVSENSVGEILKFAAASGIEAFKKEEWSNACEMKTLGERGLTAVVIDTADAVALKELAAKHGRTLKGQVKIMIKEMQ